ncbi:hypothetical protein HELRODRAFT_169450 [Helobdella robusta]|uniref:SCP domain-containing protein n=1 Tax=Helobdella robusta TaxID=6412 RepID=T1F1Y3_HELRO|nr:hypothetical protein HELRODRAFT_169450 [Helobdella robusta]ESO08575.1 hypothetical protein HELRODRAFT_169450 [Helobdella robusta]
MKNICLLICSIFVCYKVNILVASIDLTPDEVELMQDIMTNLTGFPMRHEGPISNMSYYLSVDDGLLEISYGRGGLILNTSTDYDLSSSVTDSFWTYIKCLDRRCVFHPKIFIEDRSGFQCAKSVEAELTYILCYFGLMLDNEDACSKIETEEMTCDECPPVVKLGKSYERS